MSASATPPPDREVIVGTAERVTFHNAESGFCVLRIKARGVQPAVSACRLGHSRFIPYRSRRIFRIHRAMVLAELAARPAISDHAPAR